MRLELTLPALERLIGGDSEVEVQLRRQIAQAFTFRYLKGIVDKDMVEVVRSQVVGECQQELERLLAARVGQLKSVGGRYQVQLEQGLQKRLDAYIANHLDSLIAAAVERYERHIQSSVELFIRSKMNEQIRDSVRRVIDEKLMPAVRDALAGTKPQT